MSRPGTSTSSIPRAAKARVSSIGIAPDLDELRPRFARGTRWIRNGSISPVGRPGRLRLPGRDRDRPRRKRGPARHHQHAGRPRALPDLVAGRQIDRLFLGRVRRVRALCPQPRTARARPKDTISRAPASRFPGLVARRPEDLVRRQFPDALLDRPRERRPEEDRVGLSIGRARAKTRPPGPPTQVDRSMSSIRRPISRRSTPIPSTRTSRSPSRTA